MPGVVKGENLIGKWTVPLRGTLRGLPPYAIPDDALYDSLNVVVRDGAVVPRSGLVKLDPNAVQARPVGALSVYLLASGAFQTDAFQSDAFQEQGNTANSALVVVTSKRIWVYSSGSWTDLTDTLLTGLDTQFARLTVIQIGSSINVVITNGVDTPRKWDTTATVVTQLTGAPLWTDVTTASDRIVGIIPPYTVRWGNSLDLSTWPSLNYRNLADTTDPVVAIRNLGTLGVVVYKARSIWIGQPSGATDASYFAFTLRGLWDGPASASAVVDVDGSHVYMTDLGRIGYFDGVQHAWIDGVWPVVKAELDQSNAGLIFGVYEPANREVHFYYPRTGDNGICKGMAIVKMPNAAEGISEPIVFRGLSTIGLSCGTDTRLSSSREGIVFGGDTDFVGFVITPDALDDTGQFSGYFQPGLLVAPMLDLYRLEGFEVFCQRGPGYGTLQASVVAQNLLENPATTTRTPAQPIDLTQTPPTQVEGGDVTGKFLGLRFEFTAPITLRWYGARIAARRLEPAYEPMTKTR